MDDDKRIENNEEEAVSNDNIAGEEGETNSEERDKSRPYVDDVADEEGETNSEERDKSRPYIDDIAGEEGEVNGRFDASAVKHLSGMYKNWFLDYASYVILERAVPHIDDGLKPVQRRILHSMKRMDDGRYNKVANIAGHTMQFHPHGDASICDALVQMGQKDLLIDTQGNWGNIFTGDRAAAPRYIESRLSKFALETVFNPKTTEWQLSYDGRNKEPVTLPAKFPLLLAQGAEGIAVGLSSKILPHNMVEICDAAINYLKEKPFALYPDFPTGGSIDVEKYNDGQRGGTLKVRAKVEKIDNKTLVIREVPFTKTASSLAESITKAVEKGKLKIRKVEDMTASEVEIQLHLTPGTSSDKTMDALYAFTDCEVSISPNCCVISDNKPQFLTISDVLRHSVNHTQGLLRRELEIRKAELEEQLFFSSLERIFIEERIYKERGFETAKTMDDAIKFVDGKLEPFKKNFIREVKREDILRLMEIKMQRILKFNKDKADELLKNIQAEIAEINKDLSEMVRVTIEWFKHLKTKYGKDYPRKTEIKSFDTIVAAKVVDANEKLYIDRKGGFIGTDLKKAEFVQNCSNLDDVIVFYRDGKYKVVHIADKVFVDKGVIHVQVFKRNDRRTIYNVVYRDGAQGPYYIKRFNVVSVIRDKDYDLTQGTPSSRVLYFTANPNGEAETVKVILKDQPGRARFMRYLERDFSNVLIKGKGAKGVILSKDVVERVSLKAHGTSTLGGRKVWFDADVNRINYEEQGTLLGEFNDKDTILVVLDNGEFYTTNFDAANHYEDNIFRLEKFDPEKTWTAVVIDADNQGYPYLKRFCMENATRHQSIIGENPKSKLVFLTDVAYPRVEITYGGSDANRGADLVEAEEFVGIKGYKAKGKRLTTFKVSKIQELEPTRFPEQEESEDAEEVDENELETTNVEEKAEGNNSETPITEAENNASESSEPSEKSAKANGREADEGQLTLLFEE